ncbi:MAG: hypothetical protein M9894_34655 [Planctomycetes bacterium]|nr:hypothetical protein [Planctomycetota bacterium]
MELARSGSLALVAWLALAGVAQAQDVAPVSSDAAADVFARVVARAREAGALERVVGLHPFIMTRHFRDDEGAPRFDRRFLMTYRIAVDDDALRLDVEVKPEGAPGQVDIGYVVGLDGRLRSMVAVTGERVEAEVRDGALVVRLVDQGKTVEHPWDDRLLPKIVAAFVLPMLADQGLPEAWAFRDLNPFGQVTRPLVLRPLGEAEGLRTFGTFEGRARETTRVQVSAEGLLVGIETESSVNAAGVVTHLAASRRISPEEHDRLAPTWQDDPPPAEEEPARPEGDGPR